MNLKCHNSALELAMLSIENKLIIFNLTIFNYTLSNSSIFNQSQKPIFLLVFVRFHPNLFSWKTLIYERFN